MDSRVALQKGTVLRLTNRDGGAILYTIHSEIGRGSSCIVYDATYETNAGSTKHVRIKECYPYKLKITRNPSGKLIPSANDVEFYHNVQKKVWDDFVISSKLFYSHKLADSFVNTFDIYNENNTTYIVSAFSPKDTLAVYKPVDIRACISLVKQVALAINDVHKEGYLYLDIKPENILAVQGHCDRILLFDFDSLVPVSAIAEAKDGSGCDVRLSYTKGFSAVELQLAILNKLGPHTDVYGIGALLFYLLFGRAPTAPDCESDACIQPQDIQYDTKCYQDKLFFALDSFFQGTLASYYSERIQNMDTVIKLLDDISALSDCAVPFIYSSQVEQPKKFFGREDALAEIRDWLVSPQRCLNLYGMGGIGKSTLMREAIIGCKDCVDTVLYLPYRQNIVSTVTDDFLLKINAVERNAAETLEEYFLRKINQLKSLCHDQKVLLVLDNYESEDISELRPLLDIEWKIALISRSPLANIGFTCLELLPIANEEAYASIYEANSETLLSQNDLVYFRKIINSVGGHTLLIELLAKQIASSHISLKDAANIAEAIGFSHIGKEKVAYSKDYSVEYKTVREILNAFISADTLPQGKQTFLKMLALFGNAGTNIELLCDGLQVKTKDVANELIREGLVQCHGKVLSLHPVIAETVSGWEWCAEAKKTIPNVLRIFCDFFRAADPDQQLLLLPELESLVEKSRQIPNILSEEAYNELMYEAIIRMPRHREDLILQYGKDLISRKAYSSENVVLCILSHIIETYEEHRNFEEAASYLQLAEAIAQKADSPYVKAMYFDMLSEYYDHLLNGAYEAETTAEERLFKTILQATDKAIKYASACENGKELHAKNLLGKATLLIRAKPQKRKAIYRLIKKAEQLISDEFSADDKIRTHYIMVCAWFYTLSEPNFALVNELLQTTWENAFENIADLDDIDNRIIPCANIYCYWEEAQRATDLLLEGIRICEANEPIVPYVRKKMQLYGCYLDVLKIAGDKNQIDDLLSKIEELNKEHEPLGIRLDVS